MPISHYAFRASLLLEQLPIIWDEGTFLANLHEEEDRVNLYLGSFFVPAQFA
jgi:hypothetical protein